MQYKQSREADNPPILINLMLLLAMGGCLLAAVQAVLIVIQGDILCLNEGCEIVEKLTTVPPLVFNLAGSGYFFLVLLSLWRGATGSPFLMGTARMLLLAGMAAEGVLVSFQHYIAGVFCSYCLIIFGIICLLNILMGVRQLLFGAGVFVAVLVAFSALEFSPRTQSSEPVALEDGIYGTLERNEETNLHLFFSSTCPHCEEVIETISDNFNCSMKFNPIDTLPYSPLEEIERTEKYAPQANIRFLKNLGILEIPVLVTKTDKRITVLKGKQEIIDYFDTFCYQEESGDEVQGMSTMSGGEETFQFLTPQPPADDGCSVDAECEEPIEE